MAEMTPFKYAGFGDVPRYIVLSSRERSLQLRSEFDGELDEYESNRTVFDLPESAKNAAQDGNWDVCNQTSMTTIRQVPVRAVLGELPSIRIEPRLGTETEWRRFADDPGVAPFMNAWSIRRTILRGLRELAAMHSPLGTSL